MPTFPEIAIRQILGRDATPRFELGLFSAGKELRAEGYRRVSARRGAWQVRGAQASIKARFGPFPDGAEFDQGVLLADGEPVQEFDLAGSSVPKAGVFEFDPVLTAHVETE